MCVLYYSYIVLLQNLSVYYNKDVQRKSPSPQKEGGSYKGGHIPSANGEYILQAGKLITLGLQYEEKGDIEESFDLFKAGVDVLLNGVQGLI